MTKLSQQFLQKRKWPPYIYNEGHDNILFLDLWRCMVNLTAEDAQAHATASERLQQMVSGNHEGRPAVQPKPRQHWLAMNGGCSDFRQETIRGKQARLCRLNAFWLVKRTEAAVNQHPL